MEPLRGNALREVARAWWESEGPHESQPYLRGAAFAPDGYALLAIVNGDGQHLFLTDSQLQQETQPRALSAAARVPEAGLVYDFCWYPALDSTQPDTCFWASTRRHGPVQLWSGAVEGEGKGAGALRATYRVHDAADEVQAALALAFAPAGERLHAACRDCIASFTTSRPGRDCTKLPLKGGASCLSTGQGLVAAGRWDTSLLLLAEGQGAALSPVAHLVGGHTGGITQVLFLEDGRQLVTGARMDDGVCVWDARAPSRPLCRLARRARTNQRLALAAAGALLASGGSDGRLRVWDLARPLSTATTDAQEPHYTFGVHDESCNSVSWHPSAALLATGAGERRVRAPACDEPDAAPPPPDNSLVLWAHNLQSLTADQQDIM